LTRYAKQNPSDFFKTLATKKLGKYNSRLTVNEDGEAGVTLSVGSQCGFETILWMIVPAQHFDFLEVS
jgi:hypothetical protein